MTTRDGVNPFGLCVAGCALMLMAIQRQGHQAMESRALRSVYASVGTQHPDVLGAIDATDLPGARRRIGEESSFTGTVSVFYVPQDGSVRLLDFHPDYRQAIVVAVKPADYGRFGGLAGLEHLAGQRVLVRGRFFLFKGRPEVELASPAQIKLVR